MKKPFEKPPLSILDQIDHLKEKGLLIPDPDRAIHYLTHISYYRLSGYWHPFQIDNGDGTHRFQEGLTFDVVLHHYVFDRALRLLVMDAMERVEISLRNQWSCALSMTHGAHAYLNPELFCSHGDHAESLAALAKEVKKSQEMFIKHYLKTYDPPDLPPVWAVCKIMSLGQLSRWYKLLKEPALRQRIANTYYLDEKNLVSLFHHLTTVRNCCAHHSRLWNRRFTVIMQLPKRKPENLTPNFNPASERHLYNTLVMLAYMMDIMNPGHHWKERLGGLLTSYPDVQVQAMGFPKDWQDRPIWKGKLGHDATKS